MVKKNACEDATKQANAMSVLASNVGVTETTNLQMNRYYNLKIIQTSRLLEINLKMPVKRRKHNESGQSVL